MEGKGILIILAHLLCLEACSILNRGWQTLCLTLVLIHYKVVILGKNIATKANRERRELLVNLLKACLLIAIEKCTATNKIVVNLLGEANLLCIKVAALAGVVDSLHTLKEICIHQNLVAVNGQLRHQLTLKLLQLVISLGSANHTEDICHIREHTAAAVHCSNGVLKCRFVALRNDCCNLLIMQRDSALEGWLVVVCLDALKWRNTIRCCPLLKEWVWQVIFCLVVATNHRNCQ